MRTAGGNPSACRRSRRILMSADAREGGDHHHRGLGERMRQRLWFEPHWHAAALLLCVPAQDAALSTTAM
jgi:hypothetical protein